MIKGWLQRMAFSLQRFMQGRYGTDKLSVFLLICSLIFVALSNFKALRFVYFIGLALVILSLYRSLSRNFEKRYRELAKFNKFAEKPRAFFTLTRNKWRDRKTHRYFKCKSCKATLRVPKNRGKIEITCPKCGQKAIKKT